MERHHAAVSPAWGTRWCRATNRSACVRRHAGKRSAKARGGQPGVCAGGKAAFGDVRGLFGGAAARLVVSAKRTGPMPFDEAIGERGVLLALAATAYHAHLPQPGALQHHRICIVGHGALGRLLARIAVAMRS